MKTSITLIDCKVVYNYQANLFQALSEREEMLGNYPEALEYNEMYAENLLQIITINSDKRLLELQKKYDYEKLI